MKKLSSLLALSAFAISTAATAQVNPDPVVDSKLTGQARAEQVRKKALERERNANAATPATPAIPADPATGTPATPAIPATPAHKMEPVDPTVPSTTNSVDTSTSTTVDANAKVKKDKKVK